MTFSFVRYALPPIARFLTLLLLVTIAVFLLLEMIPGNPIDMLVPPGATPEQREAAEQAYGLDRPLFERYLAWIGGVLMGNLGRSPITHVPVAESIAARAPVSLELTVLAILVALAVAIPVAVWSAYRPGRLFDRIATALTSATLAIPAFVLGILLVYVFAVTLKWFPVLGYRPFATDPLGHIWYMVLPVITLAAGEMVLFTRLLKGDMIATLQQDHVLAARARGLPTSHILTGHSLRQSSFSLVTVSAVVIGRLIGGTVIVETIFGLPGMGTLVVNAILTRDFLVVQAVVLLSAVLFLVLNAVVDLTYPLLDPRVKAVRTS